MQTQLILNGRQVCEWSCHSSASIIHSRCEQISTEYGIQWKPFLNCVSTALLSALHFVVLQWNQTNGSESSSIRCRCIATDASIASRLSRGVSCSYFRIAATMLTWHSLCDVISF